MLVYPPLITKLTTNYDDFIHVKLLFIVLSLVAALLLPIKRLIIEVKGLPTHRDSTTLHSGVPELQHLLPIPFIRESITNFDQSKRSSEQKKTG